MLAARTAAGLSQQQVADKIRVSKAAVSSWELGVQVPRIVNLKNYAKVCGTTAARLLCE